MFCCMCNVFFKVDRSYGDASYVNWNMYDKFKIDNFQFSLSFSHLHLMHETSTEPAGVNDSL